MNIRIIFFLISLGVTGINGRESGIWLRMWDSDIHRIFHKEQLQFQNLEKQSRRENVLACIQEQRLRTSFYNFLNGAY